MSHANINQRIYVDCTCGHSLSVSILDHNGTDVTLEVPPCADCLDDARTSGHSDGYAEAEEEFYAIN